jgi:hypothetical protein
MLTGIFSNRNIERILFFLFINERCYPSQIQSLLKVPLTPVQKALHRLEKAGIIESRYEGKTRIYQFRPSYPLRLELETVLKKAYTLLPPQEKKRYCFIHKPRLRFKEELLRDRAKNKELQAFWERLGQVQQLSFSAKERHGEAQSTKIGKADVIVISNPSSYVFQEKGTWFHDKLPDTGFSNSFRWTLDLNASLITLEHLRYGPAHPVFLFHLTPTHSHILESVDAHLCADDTYLGNIVWNAQGIDLHWRIIGPHKNNHLIYHYV